MMIEAIRHQQAFNDRARGGSGGQVMRMVVTGVSSIQFMDAVKEISCKLGWCRDLRSDQVSSRYWSLWWQYDDDHSLVAPPLGTRSCDSVTPGWCVWAIYNARDRKESQWFKSGLKDCKSQRPRHRFQWGVSGLPNDMSTVRPGSCQSSHCSRQTFPCRLSLFLPWDVLWCLSRLIPLKSVMLYFSRFVAGCYTVRIKHWSDK